MQIPLILYKIWLKNKLHCKIYVYNYKLSQYIKKYNNTHNEKKASYFFNPPSPYPSFVWIDITIELFYIHNKVSCLYFIFINSLLILPNILEKLCKKLIFVVIFSKDLPIFNFQHILWRWKTKEDEFTPI